MEFIKTIDTIFIKLRSTVKIHTSQKQTNSWKFMFENLKTLFYISKLQTFENIKNRIFFTKFISFVQTFSKRSFLLKRSWYFSNTESLFLFSSYSKQLVWQYIGMCIPSQRNLCKYMIIYFDINRYWLLSVISPPKQARSRTWRR